MSAPDASQRHSHGDPGHRHHPVHAPESAASRARRRGRLAASADPNVGYRIEDFLDDQLRLLTAVAGCGSEHPDTVETPDRRSRRVYTAELREALGRSGCAQAFLEKYGPGSAESHLRRFALVLEFIEHCREKIVWSGLADEQEQSVAVRDELLGWLLEKPLDPGQKRIEPWVLRRFLDEWSHRWM